MKPFGKDDSEQDGTRSVRRLDDCCRASGTRILLDCIRPRRDHLKRPNHLIRLLCDFLVRCAEDLDHTVSLWQHCVSLFASLWGAIRPSGVGVTTAKSLSRPASYFSRGRSTCRCSIHKGHKAARRTMPPSKGLSMSIANVTRKQNV